MDSTGLKLCGAGEWLGEKHGTRKRRSWRKLHIGVDAGTGEIVAATLTTKDVDDAFEVGPLLEQLEGPLASFTGDGAYDQDRPHVRFRPGETGGKGSKARALPWTAKGTALGTSLSVFATSGLNSPFAG